MPVGDADLYIVTNTRITYLKITPNLHNPAYLHVEVEELPLRYITRGRCKTLKVLTG